MNDMDFGKVTEQSAVVAAKLHIYCRNEPEFDGFFGLSMAAGVCMFLVGLQRWMGEDADDTHRMVDATFSAVLRMEKLAKKLGLDQKDATLKEAMRSDLKAKMDEADRRFEELFGPGSVPPEDAPAPSTAWKCDCGVMSSGGWCPSCGMLKH